MDRLLKETGRFSNSPVFVVGIFSGADKLGEGFGSSLKMAEYRVRTSYLFYSILLMLTSSLLPSGGRRFAIKTLSDATTTAFGAASDVDVPGCYRQHFRRGGCRRRGRVYAWSARRQRGAVRQCWTCWHPRARSAFVRAGGGRSRQLRIIMRPCLILQCSCYRRAIDTTLLLSRSTIGNDGRECAVQLVGYAPFAGCHS